MANPTHKAANPLFGGLAFALRRSPVPVYAATLFVGALLLFWIEPLVAKLMLPLLGGASAVWNTAMMFFQAMLLAGYGYAHLLSRRVPAAKQPWVHGAVLLSAFAVLPIAIGNAVPPVAGSPVFWLVRHLFVCVGLPFFAVSSTAPLLQSWFARSGDRSAGDPYFLYSASNLGSLLALLAFPLVLEPWLTLGMQGRLWSLLYGLLVVLIGVCALRSQADGWHEAAAGQNARVAGAVTLRQRALWVALAFVPSSLMLGVTSFTTTDIASVPLLWIIPLTLYLLSFVITFARRRIVSMAWPLFGQAVQMAFLALLFIVPTVVPVGLALEGHYIAFFLTALVCHGTLAARRPEPTGLTEFYFCLSLGGALGGVFNALLAPRLFSSTYEYPLVLILACLLRLPALGRSERLNRRDILFPAALLVYDVVLIRYWSSLDAASQVLLWLAVIVVPAAVFCLSGRAVRFALAVAAVLVPVTVARSTDGVLDQARSFYGVYRVRVDPAAPMLDLIDGTVLHGAEFIAPARWRDELRYYAEAGPLGQFFEALRAARPTPLHIGVTGLGTGALACYSRPDEAWTFFEIDPLVVAIARDTRFFHYLELCGQRARILLGDARLSLKSEPNDHFDVLILDAFSSDAIPIHLLTREALLLDLDKITDHGVILIHISNQHLKLAPELAATARDLGLAQRHQLFAPSPEQAPMAVGSEWMVLARRTADLAFLDRAPGWQPYVPTRSLAPWTDDFSNILSVMQW
jgi:hypothetical protein